MTNVISDRKDLIKKLKETFEKVVDRKISEEESVKELNKVKLALKLEDIDILNRMSEFIDSLIQFILQENNAPSELTDEKRKRILARASDYDDYYENLSDDEILYGLKDD